ncbi:MAG: hypothetical protein LBE22_08955 [Azoarcus sp.]|jgi:hypothetical protein|nr:hypothetical protein [Azoarcus sp.]
MKTISICISLLFVTGVSQAADWTYASWLADETYKQVISERVCTLNVLAQDPANTNPNFACARGADTAISGLGLNTAPEAMNTLAKLLAVWMSAETAEALSCSIHVHGKAVLPAFKSLQPAQARQKCLETVAGLEEKLREKKFREEVCLDEKTIAERRDRYIREVTAGDIVCEPWEY